VDASDEQLSVIFGEMDADGDCAILLHPCEIRRNPLKLSFFPFVLSFFPFYFAE